MEMIVSPHRIRVKKDEIKNRFPGNSISAQSMTETKERYQ
jgi:hypothetical protein